MDDKSLADSAEESVHELGESVEQHFHEGYKGLSRVVMPIAIFLARRGITANMVTAFRIPFAIPLYFFCTTDMHNAAFITYGFGMLLDFADGRVAKAMEVIGIARTQEQKDDGAFFDSMGDKIFWTKATLIITFFADLDKYLQDTTYYLIATTVVILVLIEILLGKVRIEDYKKNKTSIERIKLEAPISGKLKMVLEGFGTGGLYLYFVPLHQFSVLRYLFSHKSLMIINQTFLVLGVGMLICSLIPAYRSYRHKRPRLKRS